MSLSDRWVHVMTEAGWRRGDPCSLAHSEHDRNAPLLGKKGRGRGSGGIIQEREGAHSVCELNACSLLMNTVRGQRQRTWYPRELGDILTLASPVELYLHSASLAALARVESVANHPHLQSPRLLCAATLSSATGRTRFVRGCRLVLPLCQRCPARQVGGGWICCWGLGL
jgi:hypothetical protein